MKRSLFKPVGNSSMLKRLNRSTVLNLLRRHGGLSRKQLTELTRLDGKTITNVTSDLLKLGTIKPVGIVSRGVGRPSEILELNPNYGFAIGIDLGASHLTGIAVDFSGTIVSREHVPIRYGLPPSAILERLTKIGNQRIGELTRDRKRILGAGVCVPGTLDREAGIGVWAANLSGWKNVPLRQPLESAFGLPVWFEESTRSAALGEMFARFHENLNDFLLLDLSLGIGSAFAHNGELYYGHSGIAGEIGHTTVKPGGTLCRCGKLGCLEAEASGYAIARYYAESVKRKPDPKDSRTSSAQDVADGALKGNKTCERIFTRAARLLGIAAANAVMLLDPAHLILNGGLTRSGDLLLRPFRDALRKELTPEILDSLQVEISTLGDDGGPLGAASLVLNRVYDNPGMKEE